MKMEMRQLQSPIGPTGTPTPTTPIVSYANTKGIPTGLEGTIAPSDMLNVLSAHRESFNTADGKLHLHTQSSSSLFFILLHGRWVKCPFLKQIYLALMIEKWFEEMDMSILSCTWVVMRCLQIMIYFIKILIYFYEFHKLTLLKLQARNFSVHYVIDNMVTRQTYELTSDSVIKAFVYHVHSVRERLHAITQCVGT
jgi:hypothetical protein